MSERDEFVGLILERLEFECHFAFKIEDTFLDAGLARGFFSFFHDPEELKVSAEVKDVELFFVFSVDESGAESCSSADHLPEFCFAVDFFEEDEV